MLCDKEDFEPYVAFQRLTRNSNNGITINNIQRFLSENLIDLSIERCRNLVSHYDADKDGMLSYKEFLEIVLPKEHPDLRAYVTQRDCYNISEEEYLSYETEAAMAVLFEREVSIFAETMAQKDELDNLALSGHKIVELIDGAETGSLNFNNVQKFLHSTGLMPYDSEIIAFLRRVDRDDDGVISGEEMNNFISLFNHTDSVLDSMRRKHQTNSTSHARLKTFSPGRQIVSNKLHMVSPQSTKQTILQESSTGLVNRTVTVEQKFGGGQTVEETVVSKYPSKFDTNTVVHQTVGPSVVQTKEQVTTTVVQTPITQSTTNFANPRIRYSHPKLIAKTISHSQEELEPLAVKTSHVVTQELLPSGLVKKNSYSNLRTVSPAPVVQTQYTSIANKQVENSMVQSRVSHYSRQSAVQSVKPPGPSVTVTTTTTPNPVVIHGDPTAARTFGKQEIAVTTAGQKVEISEGINKITTASTSAFDRSRDRFQRYQSQTRVGPTANITTTTTTTNNREVSPGIQSSQLQYQDESNTKYSAYNQQEERSRTPVDKKKVRKGYRKKSPLDKKANKYTKAGLSNNSISFLETLANIIEEERSLEQSRRQLISQPDFFTQELMRLVDTRNRGKFTFDEFRFFLGRVKVQQVDTRGLIDLYGAFDSDQNCLLTINELTEMILPREPQISTTVKTTPGNGFQGFSPQTQELLTVCFNKLFNLRKTISYAKSNISDLKIDLNELFQELDTRNKGFLDRTDFGPALRKVIPNFRESDIQEVDLFTANCDLDRDGMVNFKDFYMYFSL